MTYSTAIALREYSIVALPKRETEFLSICPPGIARDFLLANGQGLALFDSFSAVCTRPAGRLP